MGDGSPLNHIISQIICPAKDCPYTHQHFDFGNLQFIFFVLMNHRNDSNFRNRAMHEEKYNVTWHSYTDHLKSMMKELMMSEDFSDVTLVTEDKKQIRAHINILSACSPVFKDILKKDRNSSPIKYLRGVKYLELESIMQFIYLGEATFYKERIDEFLAVAKSLKIEELCYAINVSIDHPDVSHSPIDQDTSNDLMEEQTCLYVNQDTQKKGIIRVNEFECNQCHKTYSGTGALSQHRQSVHQGIKYECNQCDKRFTDKRGLKRHILIKHEGVRYACDQCNYQATTHSHLKVHIQSMHEGVKYACELCNYQSAHRSGLTKHIETKHEGRYACHHCDYQACREKSLTLHILSKHEGVKYACDQCDQQFTQQSYLTRHIKSKHEGVNYECDQCHFQATTQGYLKQHIRSSQSMIVSSILVISVTTKLQHKVT